MGKQPDYKTACFRHEKGIRMRAAVAMGNPLTEKGDKIMRSMKKTYGKKKGKQVFHASANKGKIKGVHR